MWQGENTLSRRVGQHRPKRQKDA